MKCRLKGFNFFLKCRISQLCLNIDKYINIDRLYTQNHQELYSELILLGVKVYFNDKRGG